MPHEEQSTKTYFNEKLQKIQDIVGIVTKSGSSDFYISKYKDISASPINSYEDFLKIPFLTKDELFTPGLDQLNLTDKNITHFGVSSGTTNNKRPLIIPQIFPDVYSQPYQQTLCKKQRIYDEDHLVELGVKNYMVLVPPYTPAVSLLLVPKSRTVAYLGDISNMEISAIIAAGSGLSGLVTTPTVALIFSEKLKAIGFDLSQIKWLLLFGELCTNDKFEMLKETFSSAEINFCFGYSEIADGTAFPGQRCKNQLASPANIYHVTNDYYIEIIDKKGKVLGFNEEGEIVLTSLGTNKAFPLIRYQTGDIGRLYFDPCTCGENIILEIGGRGDYDLLKIQGTTLRADKIAPALAEFEKYLQPGFQIHVYEEKVGEKLMPRLELQLVFKKGMETRVGLKEIIREGVSNNLKLSQTRTLTDLVEMGVFQPLTLKFLNKWSTGQYKSKNIISHLE